MNRCLSVRDFEREARRILPRCVEGYVCGGTEDGASLDESVRALRDIGYSEWVTIESFATGIVGLCAAACIWRPIYGSADGLARDGLAFLKRHLAAA